MRAVYAHGASEWCNGSPWDAPPEAAPWDARLPPRTRASGSSVSLASLLFFFPFLSFADEVDYEEQGCSHFCWKSDGLCVCRGKEKVKLGLTRVTHGALPWAGKETGFARNTQ